MVKRIKILFIIKRCHAHFVPHLNGVLEVDLCLVGNVEGFQPCKRANHVFVQHAFEPRFKQFELSTSFDSI